MKRLFVFSLLLWLQISAFAVDIKSLNVADKVTDGDVTFGQKTIRLPGGDWYLAGIHKSYVTNTQSYGNETFLVYLAQVQNKKFQSGLVISTNMGSTGGHRWTNDVRCVNSKGELYRNEFKGNVMHPECLLITKNNTHLRQPASGNIFPQAQEWMRQNGVVPKGAFYEIYYEVQVPGNIGRAQYYVSAENAPSEALLIEYANEFANRLRGAFTEREKLGTIPELPARQ